MEKAAQAIRVLIADDHTLFREGIRALLMATPDIVCAGEAQTGDEAIAQTIALKPDVVIMDINMPGLNGIQATRAILSASPMTAIIMVTMLEDDATVFAAMRAGALGYVLKGAHHNEMLQSIRAASQGQALFGPAIARRMKTFFLEGASFVTDTTTSVFPELTMREIELLDLIAQGHNNAEIASRLVISPNTVRNHITSIFNKLNVANRSQAIVKARQAGLGK